ncbi:MAG TPA: glycosyltransferase [Pyrinomonadaceae bacterium]|nr:glycosyltransferase [Pyrinomonadaceae bacterium]
MNPLLSVCIITYNHAAFIEQAIRSVIAQKHSYEWEVIIADDASTDGTSEIVTRLAAEFPKAIRAVIQPQNLGPGRNFKELLSSASGKYIAYLEGDDYWTDPLKLQKQVNFLEGNPDFSVCFHDAHVVYLNRRKNSHNIVSDLRDEFSFCDVIEKNFSVPSCSIVFRNQPDDFAIGLDLLDWVLLLLLARRGKVKRLDGVMAVYRQHSGGWTNNNATKNALELVNITKRCRDFFGPKYFESFDRILAINQSDVCFGSFQDGDVDSFLSYYREIGNYWKYLPESTRRALLIRKRLAQFPRVAKLFARSANGYREYKLLRRKGF